VEVESFRSGNFVEVVVVVVVVVGSEVRNSLTFLDFPPFLPSAKVPFEAFVAYVERIGFTEDAHYFFDRDEGKCGAMFKHIIETSPSINRQQQAEMTMVVAEFSRELLSKYATVGITSTSHQSQALLVVKALLKNLTLASKSEIPFSLQANDKNVVAPVRLLIVQQFLHDQSACSALAVAISRMVVNVKLQFPCKSSISIDGQTSNTITEEGVSGDKIRDSATLKYLSEFRPEDIKLDLKVLCRSGGSEQFFPARIERMSADGKFFDILYEKNYPIDSQQVWDRVRRRTGLQVGGMGQIRLSFLQQEAASAGVVLLSEIMGTCSPDFDFSTEANSHCPIYAHGDRNSWAWGDTSLRDLRGDIESMVSLKMQLLKQLVPLETCVNVMSKEEALLNYSEGDDLAIARVDLAPGTVISVGVKLVVIRTRVLKGKHFHLGGLTTSLPLCNLMNVLVSFISFVSPAGSKSRGQHAFPMQVLWLLSQAISCGEYGFQEEILSIKSAITELLCSEQVDILSCNCSDCFDISCCNRKSFFLF
jgi:hypothetical protein